jgi:hypothetical protein
LTWRSGPGCSSQPHKSQSEPDCRMERPLADPPPRPSLSLPRVSGTIDSRGFRSATCETADRARRDNRTRAATACTQSDSPTSARRDQMPDLDWHFEYESAPPEDPTSANTPPMPDSPRPHLSGWVWALTGMAVVVVGALVYLWRLGDQADRLPNPAPQPTRFRQRSSWS